MSMHYKTNDEIARDLAAAVKAWRISDRGAGMSQVELAEKSGIGLTPLKRFEKTGAITLRNLISIMRAFNMLENLTRLIPDPSEKTPIEILEEEEKKAMTERVRAPRKTTKTKVK